MIQLPGWSCEVLASAFMTFSDFRTSGRLDMTCLEIVAKMRASTPHQLCTFHADPRGASCLPEMCGSGRALQGGEVCRHRGGAALLHPVPHHLGQSLSPPCIPAWHQLTQSPYFAIKICISCLSAIAAAEVGGRCLRQTNDRGNLTLDLLQGTETWWLLILSPS